ncbi:MAG: BatD family protein, partial [Proteobacteria bacterium]|nr:BatD family protein [Pseudomonadota bacterium]
MALWGFVIFIVGSCSAPAPNSGNTHPQAPLPPVEFRAQVDKAAATVGDLITLTLSLSSEPQIAVRLPEAGSRIAGLRIVDDGEEGPKMVDNRTVQKKWYKFQPDSVGSYIIPALSVIYTDARGAQQELKSAQLFIEVKSVLQDKPLIYGALMVLLLTAGGVFLFYYLGKKKNQLPAPPDPAHIRAFEELEQLSREQLLERGIVREYYFRLSEIFRRYIERRFHIPAVERTTEEIMPDILNLQECGSALKAETREILRYADLVKFARFCPDRNTSDNDYRKVVRVIEETK